MKWNSLHAECQKCSYLRMVSIQKNGDHDYACENKKAVSRLFHKISCQEYKERPDDEDVTYKQTQRPNVLQTKKDTQKGQITKWNGHFSTGMISGEDGVDYFVHQSDIDKESPKKGHKVEFEIVDEGKEHKRAVNVHVTSIGKNHPACHDIERLIDYIRDNTEENEEQECRIRDLMMLYNYFADACPEPGNFRNKYRPKKGEQ